MSKAKPITRKRPAQGKGHDGYAADETGVRAEDAPAVTA